jgi:hypothetical protein
MVQVADLLVHLAVQAARQRHRTWLAQVAQVVAELLLETSQAMAA